MEEWRIRKEKFLDRDFFYWKDISGAAEMAQWWRAFAAFS